MDHPHVSNIDRIDDGIVLTFTNGVVLFFSAEFLWSHRQQAMVPIRDNRIPE